MGTHKSLSEGDNKKKSEGDSSILLCKLDAISELPLASFSKRVLVSSLSYENEICRFKKSFSYEWLCTRPRFDREAEGNSEMGYSVTFCAPF